MRQADAKNNWGLTTINSKEAYLDPLNMSVTEFARRIGILKNNWGLTPIHRTAWQAAVRAPNFCATTS